MTSAIDSSKPITGSPTTQSVRDNFAAAKSEIEALQARDQVSKFSIVGALTALVGAARWYPDHPIVIDSVYFSQGGAALGATVIDVKKNGTSIFSGSLPTCAPGGNKSTIISNTTTMAITDYLTVDVLSGSGSDATVCIVYH